MAEENLNSVDTQNIEENNETLNDILDSVTIDEPSESSSVKATEKASQTQNELRTTDSGQVSVSRAEYDNLLKTQQEIARRLDNQDAREAQNAVKDDISKAVNQIKEVTSLPERMIKGDLYARADEDPRFAKAFENRHDDPTTWNKILEKVSAELAETSKQVVDPQIAANQQALQEVANSAGNAPAPEIDDSDWKIDDDAAFMTRFMKLAGH